MGRNGGTEKQTNRRTDEPRNRETDKVRCKTERSPLWRGEGVAAGNTRGVSRGDWTHASTPRSLH
ncbi:hypothetical protein DDZ15_15440 [Rhodohalobacter mucosus]|uniref:Uncharacterized protein n=1 Tax=Rhodohalobacter mucosus TaxID=2079485 RepID=A0A316TZE2_9BACT|nr:hypothetical protein DDZ15_15440 [Rhodohalobacter mucosus]